MFDSSRLTHWYANHKRDLPWRHTTAPYAIWLSEIILQQTRVDQGLAYYLRFLEKFPTVNDLAAAPLEDVLKTWQGLGYYSRARNIHKTANLVVSDHHGNFPTSYLTLLKLPGIGPYTASAIASFCAEEARPVIDGNVQRVGSRIMALEQAVDSKEGNGAILTALNTAMERALPSTFNQAIMELGALVCTPKSPNCLECPLAEGCMARQQSRQLEFPIKKAKTKVQDRYLACFILTDGKHFLLRQRDASSIWKDMADLPTWEQALPISGSDLEAGFGKLFPDLNWSPPQKHAELKHVLSHRRLHVQLYSCHVAHLPEQDAHNGWPLVESPIGCSPKLPIPRMVERLLENWMANGL